MTNEKLDKVIDKVRKLLALGSSPNENEAAAAVAKAQELLAAYDLSMESIQDLKADKRTAVTKGAAVVSTTEGKPDGWKADLFEAIASTSDCYTAYSYEYEETKGGKSRQVKSGNLIGFGHDVEMAGYALAFLIKEIERLAQAYADVMWAEIREMRDNLEITQHEAEATYVRTNGRHPLKAKLYFTRGAAEAVIANLQQAAYYRKQAAEAEARNTNTTALVISKKAAIDDYLSMEHYGKTAAEHQAEVEANIAKWNQERADALAKNPPPEAKPETEAERHKRQERERRENERYWQAQERRRDREEAKKDRTAYRQGKQEGATVSIRPGIQAGTPNKQIK